LPSGIVEIVPLALGQANADTGDGIDGMLRVEEIELDAEELGFGVEVDVDDMLRTEEIELDAEELGFGVEVNVEVDLVIGDTAVSVLLVTTDVALEDGDELDITGEDEQLWRDRVVVNGVAVRVDVSN
jgi:hypothetical protein